MSTIVLDSSIEILELLILYFRSIKTFKEWMGLDEPKDVMLLLGIGDYNNELYLLEDEIILWRIENVD